MYNKKERYRIEPFRHRVDLEPDYKEKTWELLESAMVAIFDHNPSKLSFEELYRSAYNMVLHKFGGYLYDNVMRTISARLEVVGREVAAKEAVGSEAVTGVAATAVVVPGAVMAEAALAEEGAHRPRRHDQPADW